MICIFFFFCAFFCCYWLRLNLGWCCQSFQLYLFWIRDFVFQINCIQVSLSILSITSWNLISDCLPGPFRFSPTTWLFNLTILRMFEINKKNWKFKVRVRDYGRSPIFANPALGDTLEMVVIDEKVSSTLYDLQSLSDFCIQYVRCFTPL